MFLIIIFLGEIAVGVLVYFQVSNSTNCSGTHDPSKALWPSDFTY